MLEILNAELVKLETQAENKTISRELDPKPKNEAGARSMSLAKDESQPSEAP